jgi:hypothetical protein
LASLLTFIMSRGTVATPLAVLNLHSLIVSALATTAGFQLVVFGIAAALYGMENGVPQKPWLRTLSSPNVRRGASAVGAICVAGGLGLFAALAGRWMLSGGPFYDTRGLVLASVLLSWGMEMVLTVMFISIFASRIEKTVPARRGTITHVVQDLLYVDQ